MSELSDVLRDMLRVSTQEEWARILRVTPSAISQWQNDKTVPQPEHLRTIVDLLIEDTRVEDKLFYRLDDLIQRPATEISPHGARIGPTLGHYLVRPVRKGFGRLLDTLPPLVQEAVLEETGDWCRSLRTTPPQPVPTLRARREA